MLKQIKVFVNDIQLGMYVSQLDRPWVDTPFLFQGFHINSPQEIKELQKHCEFVYVDQEQSRIEVFPKRAIAIPAQKKIIKEVQLYDAPRDIGDFRQQLKAAMRVHEKTKLFISQAMRDIQMGKNVDVKQAKRLVTELAQNVVANPTALVWLTQLKNKDEYTSLHSLNVCILSLFFGRSMRLTRDQLHTLGLGALLHDVGKLRVPTEVLTKPSRLTSEEFSVMKQHVVYGYDLMKNRSELSNDALDVIIQHHERLNGAGYPYNLHDSKISFFSKLVSIVDVYDAITSKRVYHDGTTPYKALNDIYKGRDKEFDASLVENFVKCLGVYPIGSLVELNTGQVGVVVYFAEKNHLTPTIMLVLDEHKKPYDQYSYINLGSSVWDRQGQKPEIKKIADPTEFGLDLPQIIHKESLHMAFS